MWQLDILTTRDEYPQIEALLETQDILSLVMLNAGEDMIIEHELNEKPAWSLVKVEALFETVEQADFTKQLLQATQLGQEQNIHEVEQKNWLVYSLKDFQPIEVANRLWIYPHWLIPDDAKQPFVTIDPGFAFGTGQHATTKMCLEWLTQQSLQQQTVIDYGCGSGILAIAALKMGAEIAYGIDIDPQACEASRQNAELNQIHQEQFIIDTCADALPKQTDILIANIVMNPLLAFKSFFASKVKPQGKLVLSGLLTQQLPQVIAHYATDFELLDTRTELDWGCLIFKSKKV
jgi:ribosomal protein L11 methyltransferase